MSTDNDWPAPDYWCTICDRGAEGCFHTPADAPIPSALCGVGGCCFTPHDGGHTWEDREPQPGDGPDYFADHAAWERRNKREEPE